jgi:hypothetical protein
MMRNDNLRPWLYGLGLEPNRRRHALTADHDPPFGLVRLVRSVPAGDIWRRGETARLTRRRNREGTIAVDTGRRLALPFFSSGTAAVVTSQKRITWTWAATP